MSAQYVVWSWHLMENFQDTRYCFCILSNFASIFHMAFWLLIKKFCVYVLLEENKHLTCERGLNILLSIWGLNHDVTILQLSLMVITSID
jgi:hypothetical protein